MKILIINGPNLNLLGKREPEIYGNQSFDSFFKELVTLFPKHQLQSFQSNHQGAIIDQLQQAMDDQDAVIINPGAYSHTSIAIADAIRIMKIPVIEVHISNIHARETYRNHSYTAAASKGIISGFGLDSYRLAILSL